MQCDGPPSLHLLHSLAHNKQLLLAVSAYVPSGHVD